MNDFTIEFVDELSNDIEIRMERNFLDYERSRGIDVNFTKFSLILRDDNGAIIGAMNAYTAFAEIYVDDIWIDSPYRGRGYGRRLLQELVDRFKGKGFNNVNLVTSAFQAPEFYKKCGFSVEFVRENIKNPQLTKFFFIKYFEDEIQMQGIYKSKS